MPVNKWAVCSKLQCSCQCGKERTVFGASLTFSHLCVSMRADAPIRRVCAWMYRSTHCSRLTFPQECPGTLQLLADAGRVERRAHVRDVHIHICPPRHQSLHAAVMTCKVMEREDGNQLVPSQNNSPRLSPRVTLRFIFKVIFPPCRSWYVLWSLVKTLKFTEIYKLWVLFDHKHVVHDVIITICC